MNLKKSKKLRVFYFGADMPWEKLINHGFRRRNTCFLQSIVNNNDVDKVYVVRQSTRRGLFNSILSSKIVNKKVKDIFITTILPQRKWLPLSKQFNIFFVKILILLQTGKANIKTDIIWIYWIQAYLFAKRINMAGRYIFDVDHNIIDDDNLPNNEKEYVSNVLVDIGNNSEYILSASRSMIKWFENKGFNNCLVSRNGIDPLRFVIERDAPADLTNIPKPRILYVGTLSKWINTKLLIQLIKKHPEWNFIFIGGNYKTDISDELTSLSNVYLLGFKLADEVPAYMANVDIGLGMYKDAEWLDVDSMKFYEYLAAKIPVVTTNYHPNINSDFNQLIKSSNNLDEIETIIQDLLLQSDTTENKWKKNTETFINNNTWDNRIAEVINKL